jgi:O-succinylbenzoic acid--CoA ligase
VGGLIFDGHHLSFEELVHYNIPTNFRFQKALQFCKAYLSRQKQFPFKTSGSTGTPKSIQLTREQLKHSAWLTINALELLPGSNALVCISTEHIGGVMMLVRGMEIGMELYLSEPASQISTEDFPCIDFVALVPVQLQFLLNNAEGQQFLNDCTTVIVGGGHIDPKIEASLIKIKSAVYQTFGMTETVSHIALRRLNGSNKQYDFHAFSELRLSLDSRGCLVVAGPLTDEQPVITNDLVALKKQNRFKWLGRWDRAINTGGYKVLPEQLRPMILQVLESLSIDCKFVVIGLPDAKWGQQVTMILEHVPLTKDLEAQVIQQLKERLHPYEVPKETLYFDEFPRTATGKIDILNVQKLLIDIR